MNSKNFPEHKGLPIHMADNLIAIYEPLSIKCEILGVSQAYGRPRSVTATALPFQPIISEL
jgi:hypothetical protein